MSFSPLTASSSHDDVPPSPTYSKSHSPFYPPSSSPPQSLYWSVSGTSEKIINVHIGHFTLLPSTAPHTLQRIVVNSHEIRLFIETSETSISQQTLPIFGTAINSCKLLLNDSYRSIYKQHTSSSSCRVMLDGLLLLTDDCRLHFLAAKCDANYSGKHLQNFCTTQSFKNPSLPLITKPPRIYIDDSQNLAVLQLHDGHLELLRFRCTSKRVDVRHIRLSFLGDLHDFVCVRLSPSDISALNTLSAYLSTDTLSATNNKYEADRAADRESVFSIAQSSIESMSSLHSVGNDMEHHIVLTALLKGRSIGSRCGVKGDVSALYSMTVEERGIEETLRVQREWEQLDADCSKIVQLPNMIGGGLILLGTKRAYLLPHKRWRRPLVFEGIQAMSEITAIEEMTLHRGEYAWIVGHNDGYMYILQVETRSLKEMEGWREDYRSNEDAADITIAAYLHVYPLDCLPSIKHISSIAIAPVSPLRCTDPSVVSSKFVLHDLYVCSDRYEQWLLRLKIPTSWKTHGNSPLLNTQEPLSVDVHYTLGDLYIDKAVEVVGLHKNRSRCIAVEQFVTDTRQPFQETVLACGNGTSGSVIFASHGYELDIDFSVVVPHSNVWFVKLDVKSLNFQNIITSGSFDTRCWRLQEDGKTVKQVNTTSLLQNEASIHCSTIQPVKLTRWIQVTRWYIRLLDTKMNLVDSFDVSTLSTAIPLYPRIACATSSPKHIVLCVMPSLVNRDGENWIDDAVDEATLCKTYIIQMKLTDTQMEVHKLLPLGNRGISCLDLEDDLMVIGYGDGYIGMYSCTSCSELVQHNVQKDLGDEGCGSTAICAVKLVSFHPPVLHVLIGFTNGYVVAYTVDGGLKKERGIEYLKGVKGYKHKQGCKAAPSTQRGEVVNGAPPYIEEGPPIKLLSVQKWMVGAHGVEQFTMLERYSKKTKQRQNLIFIPSNQPCVLSTISHGDHIIRMEKLCAPPFMTARQLVSLPAYADGHDVTASSCWKVVWMAVATKEGVPLMCLGELIGPTLHYEELQLPGMPHLMMKHDSTKLLVVVCVASPFIEEDTFMSGDENCGVCTRVVLVDPTTKSIAWGSQALTNTLHEPEELLLENFGSPRHHPEEVNFRRAIYPNSLCMLPPVSPTSPESFIVFGGTLECKINNFDKNQEDALRGYIYLFKIIKENQSYTMKTVLIEEIQGVPQNVFVWNGSLLLHIQNKLKLQQRDGEDTKQVEYYTAELRVLSLKKKKFQASRILQFADKSGDASSCNAEFSCVNTKNERRIVWSEPPEGELQWRRRKRYHVDGYSAVSTSSSQLHTNKQIHSIAEVEGTLSASMEESSSHDTMKHRSSSTVDSKTTGVYMKEEEGKCCSERQSFGLSLKEGDKGLNDRSTENQSINTSDGSHVDMNFNKDDDTCNANYETPLSKTDHKLGGISSLTMGYQHTSSEFVKLKAQPSNTISDKVLNDVLNKKRSVEALIEEDTSVFETPKLPAATIHHISSLKLEKVYSKAVRNGVIHMHVRGDFISFVYLDGKVEIWRIQEMSTQPYQLTMELFAQLSIPLSSVKCWILKDNLFLCLDNNSNLYSMKRMEDTCKQGNDKALKIISMFYCWHPISSICEGKVAEEIHRVLPAEWKGTVRDYSECKKYVWSSYDGAFGCLLLFEEKHYKRLEILDRLTAKAFRQYYSQSIIGLTSFEQFKAMSADAQEEDDYRSTRYKSLYHNMLPIRRRYAVDGEMIERFLILSRKDKFQIISELQDEEMSGFAELEGQGGIVRLKSKPPLLPDLYREVHTLKSMRDGF